MKIATYTRISTDEKTQPYSLEAQAVRLDSYAKSQDDWQIVRRFTDQASGAILERPGLERALSEAEAGRFDLLLVYRVDRLSRSVRGLAQILERLDAAEVLFRSATEPFDTASSAGRMMVQMLGVFAEFERATIVERTVAGMERKAERGEWVGGNIPFGYRLDADRRFLVPEPSEASVVPQIFHRYAERLEGSSALAKWLTERGYRTRQDKPFNVPAVLAILRNRTYLGEISFRGTHHPAPHEPLVEEALFERAQEVLREPHRGQVAASDPTSPNTCSPAWSSAPAAASSTSARRRTATAGATATTCASPASATERKCVKPTDCRPMSWRRRSSNSSSPCSNASRWCARRSPKLSRRSTPSSRSGWLSWSGSTAICAAPASRSTATSAPSRRARCPSRPARPRIGELTERLRGLQARREELSAEEPDEREPLSDEDLALLQAEVREVIEGGDPPTRKALLQSMVEEIRVVKPRGDLPVFLFAGGSTTVRISTPGWIRTSDPRLRRPSLCPLSYGGGSVKDYGPDDARAGCELRRIGLDAERRSGRHRASLPARRGGRADAADPGDERDPPDLGTALPLAAGAELRVHRLRQPRNGPLGTGRAAVHDRRPRRRHGPPARRARDRARPRRRDLDGRDGRSGACARPPGADPHPDPGGDLLRRARGRR